MATQNHVKGRGGEGGGVGAKDDNKLPIVVVCLLLPVFGVELKSKWVSRKRGKKRARNHGVA